MLSSCVVGTEVNIALSIFESMIFDVFYRIIMIFLNSKECKLLFSPPGTLSEVPKGLSFLYLCC